MKIIKIINTLVLLILLLAGITSCTVNKHIKEIRSMNIEFQPLDRADFKIIGNLTATDSITKKGNVLDKKYRKNYKRGNYNDLIQTNELAVQPQASPLGGLFGALMGRKKTLVASDPAKDFGLFALMEKYPDIDYFTNVRINRDIKIVGKVVTETVKIKADGIKLRTDK